MISGFSCSSDQRQKKTVASRDEPLHFAFSTLSRQLSNAFGKFHEADDSFTRRIRQPPPYSLVGIPSSLDSEAEPGRQHSTSVPANSVTLGFSMGP